MKTTGRSWAFRSTAGCIALVFCAASCTTARTWRVQTLPTGERIANVEAPFLKVHLRDGRLYVLRDFAILEHEIRGRGLRYSPQRQLGTRGEFVIPMEDVALLETNVLEEGLDAHGAAVTVGVILGVLVLAAVIGVAVVAATGSCPTLYRDGVEGPVAELFSHSIVRTLEAEDYDALGVIEADANGFELTLRNEFPETHYIRRLALWTARIPDGFERIRRGRSGRAFATRAARGPASCEGLGPDCADRLDRVDGVEAATRADPADLSAPSVSHLRFVVDRPELEHGLVVAGHRSMVGTWVLNRMLSYWGDEAGAFMARLENDLPLLARVVGFAKAMGALELEVRTRDGWRPVGTFAEVGPMATDAWLIPLPANVLRPELDVRLTMARGFFVLDAVQLVELGPEVVLEAAAPQIVEAVGLDPARAAADLAAPDRHMVTFGGQSARLRFPVGPGRREAFVAATGFYHEWIRPGWPRAADPATFERYLADPSVAFRELAPLYHAAEPQLVEDFWAATIREPLPGLGGER